MIPPDYRMRWHPLIVKSMRPYPIQHEGSPTLVSMWAPDGLPVDAVSLPSLSYAAQWMLTHPQDEYDRLRSH